VCLGALAYAQGNGAGNGNGNTEGAGANGKVIHETREAHASNRAASNMSISYHGGPVMLGTVHAYFIWYGTWDKTSKSILQNLVNGIGTSPYYNINTTYYSQNSAGTKTYVSPSVTLAGEADDAYSQGPASTSLSDTQIQNIVTRALSNGMTKDVNGVYFVLTSKDVHKSGFCTSYCGWHTRSTINGTDIKYSFVGNPETHCPSSCSEQTTTSPNNNIGVDAMASILAHELEEAVTDPDLNAWYDKRGAENADKCAWTFGTTYSANGALYNVVIGGLKYLIQQNWVNSGSGYCAMAY
jgi:hypothetical protein